MKICGDDKSLDILRRVSGGLDDFRLAVRLKTVVACATQHPVDINVALNKAALHGCHQCVSAEALLVIVKIYTRLGELEKARNIVGNKKLQIPGLMLGMDTYYHAQACIALAKASGQQHDIEEARSVISGISKRHQDRNQARADLSMALTDAHQDPAAFPFDLSELASVVLQLESFEDASVVTPKESSIFLHLMANSIISLLFAKMLK